MATEIPSITCPRCGSVSYNAYDVTERYCGSCHDWTGDTPPGVTHRIEDLLGEVRQHYPDGWTWQVIGVFPTPDLEGVEAELAWFNYTSGLGPCELHVPCTSIEGRALSNDLACVVLNTIAGAWQMGLVAHGDSVIVPLGIPGADGDWERDADSVWWISSQRVPARSKAVNMTAAEWCVPLRWSSPLGWPDE